MSSAIELLVTAEDKNCRDEIAECSHCQELEIEAKANPKAPLAIKIVDSISNRNVRGGSFDYAWSGLSER